MEELPTYTESWVVTAYDQHGEIVATMMKATKHGFKTFVLRTVAFNKATQWTITEHVELEDDHANWNLDQSEERSHGIGDLMPDYASPWRTDGEE